MLIHLGNVKQNIKSQINESVGQCNDSGGTMVLWQLPLIKGPLSTRQ